MKLILENWRKYMLTEKKSDHASVVVIIDDDGKFLLLKRADWNDKSAGIWNLPGGGAEQGEAPEETATREVKEESGLDINISDECLIHTKNKTDKNIYFYACGDFSGQVDKERFSYNDNRDVKHEHSEFKWIHPDELDQHQCMPDTELVVRKAYGQQIL